MWVCIQKSSVSGSAVGSDGTVISTMAWAPESNQTHQLHTLPAISGPHETDVDRPFQNGQSVNKFFLQRENKPAAPHLARGIVTNQRNSPKKSACHCLCQPSEFASLSSARFQVLFHSPFGVLFIFRSHYLFAIGLLPIFSLARDLPRTLRCTPKQRDSPIAQFSSACIPSHTGLSPSLAVLSRHT